MTGGRPKRVAEYIGDDTFCLTYADYVSDVDIAQPVPFHREQAVLATLTAIEPPGRFGALTSGRTKRRSRRSTKSHWATAAGSTGASSSSSRRCWTTSPRFRPCGNGSRSSSWRRRGALAASKHRSYWQNMDTLRDKDVLEGQWQSGQPRWKVW
jgi:glucose-1-phosphate cytidylyltransferase